MKNRILHITLLLLGLSLALMFILRILFWWYNYRFFPSVTFSEKLNILYTGSRFDLSSIAYCLIPVILLYVLHSLTAKKIWLHLSIFFTELFLIFVLLSGLFDTGFYSFNFQRSSLVTLQFAGDSLNVIKSAPLTYIGLFITGIVLIVLLHFWLKKIAKKFDVQQALSFKQVVILIPVLICLAVALRGLNARPISPLSVSLYANSNFSSVVTNTFQTTLYSILKPNNKKLFNQKNYFPLKEAAERVPFIQQYPSTGEKKYNVVLFILESFSRAYLEKGNTYKVHTPFLDTLMANSFYCTNAYANGSFSVSGIQAILAGIPAIYDYNIENSPYYMNFTRGMPAVFKERGYGTYFYYGAGKDHFGLEKFSRRLGIDHYISGASYNNQAEHNRVWGINDSAFFQFTVKEMNAQPQPFFTTVYNLSSHYPYTIPQQYNNRFPKGNSAAAQSISFVDRALQRFFEQAKKSSWYNNSIFVFVSDHWNKEDRTVNADGSGRFQIPLFIYKPDGSLKQQFTSVTDQVSIFPTLMQLTGYPNKFTSFGKSMLDADTARWTVTLKQWPSLLLFTDAKSELYFDVSTGKVNSIVPLHQTADSATGNSLLLQKAKSFVQYYNHLFTANKLADTSHLNK